jgi:hypothetical protein
LRRRGRGASSAASIARAVAACVHNARECDTKGAAGIGAARVSASLAQSAVPRALPSSTRAPWRRSAREGASPRCGCCSPRLWQLQASPALPPRRTLMPLRCSPRPSCRCLSRRAARSRQP